MIAWRIISTNSHVPYTKHGSVSTAVSFHQSLGQPFFKAVLLLLLHLLRGSIPSSPIHSHEKVIPAPPPKKIAVVEENRELGVPSATSWQNHRPTGNTKALGVVLHLLLPLTSPCLGKTRRKWRFTSLISCPRSSLLQRRNSCHLWPQSCFSSFLFAQLSDPLTLHHPKLQGTQDRDFTSLSLLWVQNLLLHLGWYVSETHQTTFLVLWATKDLRLELCT